MRIEVNGHVFTVDPAHELDIRIHVDPPEENFGPCTIQVFGGDLIFHGREHVAAVTVMTGGAKGRLVLRAFGEPEDKVICAGMSPREESKPIRFREFL